MKIILILSCVLLFGLNIFAQAVQPQQEIIEEAAVEKILLARDNGSGKAGEETDVFDTKDIPIYCVIRLTSLKPATVKMNLVAVKVAGVKAETKVITVSYKTNGNQNRVTFTGKPDGIWTAGTYRVDIFIDGKTSGSREFEIQKSTLDTEKETKQKQLPPKTNQKPKTAKRVGKN